ncbi:MAG: CHAT domain-containing protein [Pyrinomonadaceae bacterium]
MRHRRTRLLPALGRALAALLFVASLQPRLTPEARAQKTAPPEPRRAEDLREWPSREHRRAILVGVDAYASDSIPDFQAATVDAELFARALEKSAGFDRQRVTVLGSGTVNEPTRENILSSLAQLRDKIPADGLLVFAFVGRAVELNGRSYLLPSDAAVSRNPAVLEESAIRAELLKEMIEATGAGQVLLLLDPYRAVESPGTAPALPLTGRFQESFRFDLRKGEVRAYANIFAASPGQKSHLREQDAAGLFAMMFLEGLRSEAVGAPNRVTLAALISYIQSSVYALSDGVGPRAQQPTAVVEGYRPERLVISGRRPQSGGAGIFGRVGPGGAAVGGWPQAGRNPQIVLPAGTAGDRQPLLAWAQSHQLGAAIPGDENRRAVERQSWEVIRRSGDPRDYKAFLTNHPDGEFAAVAWLRYEELRSNSATTLSRFPTVRCFDTVKEGAELAVTVQLTRDLRTPDVVVSDSPTPAVGLSGEGDAGEWDVLVVLHADGFALQGGSFQKVRLRKDSDSTKALFRLKANPMKTPQEARNIEVEFWQNDTIVATATKTVTVLDSPAAARASRPPPPSGISKNAATSPAPPGNAGGGVGRIGAASPPPVPPSSAGPLSGFQLAPAPVKRSAREPKIEPETERAEQFKPRDPSSPDLTVRIKQVSASRPELFNVRITSPHFSPDVYLEEEWDTAGFSRLLKEQYGTLVPLGARGAKSARRRDAPAGEAKALVRDFGLELYRRTPVTFKTAFWELTRMLGPNFKTILVVSDDPVIPWELVLPVSDDRRVERGHLGTEFQMARWHIEGGNLIKPRGASTLRIEKIYAIIPSYSGGSALAGQKQEWDELSAFDNSVNVHASYEEVEKLFGDLPSGVIHFAGHGVIETGAREFDEYRIELEGGKLLSLQLWKGMTHNRRRNAPLIFFNACDVGATSKVAGFVDGWAPAALNAGASGYIGTLWPVGDVGAAEFGVGFYRRLRERARGRFVPVAELLRETRRLFLESGDPTALAYIYYGNHDLACTLTPAAGQ